MSGDKKKYKYDIAISFLHQDEQVARDIDNRLSPNFEVFVYSKKQEELAGTDGTESFRKVFREQARLVVVLYRDGWGKTPWTRIEEGAVKDRFFKEGWDWLLFVMVDAKSTPPPWLPETRIRLDLMEYGLEQAVGAIKARVQELGGKLHKEDAVQRAKRLEREAALHGERKKLLNSTEGVNAVKCKAKEIYAEISRRSEEINKTTGLNLSAGYDSDSSVLTNRRISISVYFYCLSTNTLENSELVVKEFNGRCLLPQEGGKILVTQPTELSVHKFVPDYTTDKEWCWRCQLDTNRCHTSQDIAEYVIKLLLDLVDRINKGDIPPIDPFGASSPPVDREF